MCRALAEEVDDSHAEGLGADGVLDETCLLKVGGVIDQVLGDATRELGLEPTLLQKADGPVDPVAAVHGLLPALLAPFAAHELERLGDLVRLGSNLRRSADDRRRLSLSWQLTPRTLRET